MDERQRTAVPDWTDLQYLVELARQGSLSAAARAVGVTHATVARRIAGLEARFGRPLFKRQAGRFIPTAIGAQILELAGAMEEPALKVARAISGMLPEIAAPVRITTTELTAAKLVVPALADFRALHPDVDVEVIVTSENLSLARRDADVALRGSRPTQGELIGRKLGDFAYYRFASRRYLDGRQPADFEYIGYCDVSGDLPEVQAFERYGKSERIALRTNHLPTRYAAVANGAGIGLLPKFMVEEQDDLVALDEKPVVSRQIWLVVHEDLHEVPRIRAVREALVKFVARRRKRLV